jgi:ADP-heptose:LPS heptosyltransferase
MISSSLYVSNVKKIAILRANALGDFIVTLPAIHAIRSAYPDAELILLGRPWHKDFLAAKRTPIDRVIVIPIMPGLREEVNEVPEISEQDFFYSQIIYEQFDIAIHFQGKGLTANPFLKKLGARLTVGLTCSEAIPLDRSLPFYYYQNEVVRYLEVASLIGASPAMVEPKINILDKDKIEVDNYFKEDDQRSFIVIHPCGTDMRRMWSENKFSELADILAKMKFRIIFSGSGEDSEMVSSIISSMTYPALNACGKFSLGGLAALFSKSQLVISIDTGPLHLARAAGSKTVGLYWAPNLINWGPLTRSDHRPVISWKMECPHCGIIPNDPYPFEPASSGCAHLFSSIAKITVEKVMEEVMGLLPPS